RVSPRVQFPQTPQKGVGCQGTPQSMDGASRNDSSDLTILKPDRSRSHTRRRRRNAAADDDLQEMPSLASMIRSHPAAQTGYLKPSKKPLEPPAPSGIRACHGGPVVFAHPRRAIDDDDPPTRKTDSRQ